MKNKVLFIALFVLSAWIGVEQSYAQEAPTTKKKSLEPKGAIANPANFQEKATNFLMSNRYKLATYQRDSLLSLGEQLKQDTAKLGNNKRSLEQDIASLKQDLNDCEDRVNSMSSANKNLKNQYSDLETSSLNQLKKMKDELDEKAVQQDLLEQELKSREKRVAELEALIRRQDSTVKAINKLIKDALLQFNSPELSVEMRNGKVYVSMSEKILFESGRSEVQQDGIKAIAKIADILNKISNVEIMVEGHTDNVPIKTPQYRDNWDLSVARATAITRLLIEMGVPAKRLTASGKAEFSPKASNLDKEGRAKNRRSEIVLIPNLDEIYQMIDKSTSGF